MKRLVLAVAVLVMVLGVISLPKTASAQEPPIFGGVFLNREDCSFNAVLYTYDSKESYVVDVFIEVPQQEKPIWLASNLALEPGTNQKSFVVSYPDFCDFGYGYTKLYVGGALKAVGFWTSDHPITKYKELTDEELSSNVSNDLSSIVLDFNPEKGAEGGFILLNNGTPEACNGVCWYYNGFRYEHPITRDSRMELIVNLGYPNYRKIPLKTITTIYVPIADQP